VIGSEEHNPFFDPLEHIVEFRLEPAPLLGSLVSCGRTEHYRGKLIPCGYRSMDASPNSANQLPFANFLDFDGHVPLARKGPSHPFLDVLLIPRAEKIRETPADVRRRIICGLPPGLPVRIFEQNHCAAIQAGNVSPNIEKSRGLRAPFQKRLATRGAANLFGLQLPAF
jgi:hypothetical protein